MGQGSNNLIWVDLEMTGLEVASNTIIEIAIVITDKDLKELDRWPHGETGQAIYQPASVLERVDPWVREELPELLERVPSSSVDLAAAEDQAITFVSRYCPDPPSESRKEGCPLAGNSIGKTVPSYGIICQVLNDTPVIEMWTFLLLRSWSNDGIRIDVIGHLT